MTLDARAPGPDAAAAPGALGARLLALWPQQDSQHVLIALDLRATIVAVSPGAPHVLGYAPAELIGRPVAVLFTEEDLALKADQLECETARRIGYSDDNRWHLRQDGTRVWIEGSLTAIHDEAQRCIGFVKLMRDRTDLRGQVETLENRVAALRGALEAKDRELTTLAHELANPLSPLLHACHLLGRADDNQARKLREVISRQLETLKRLVGDLRTTAGDAADGPALVHQRFVLQELLAQGVQACSADACARGLMLELLAADVPIWIDADPARLHQVVLNLLSNAIKYSSPGGRIWVKATVEADAAVIRIEDNGLGISPEMLPRIFDLFTQEPDARHRSEGGLGVGLSVVKQWVDLHGGTVEVRSDGRGKGSEFTVRLPLGR